MDWSKVGTWLKNNSHNGTALIGALLTGNVPGAIAAGAGMVSSVTGTTDPIIALSRLKEDPTLLVELERIAADKESHIRDHIEEMTRLQLEDLQHEHTETQETVRSGDSSLDETIRQVRPNMAKQSWTATIAYALGCFSLRALTDTDIFDPYMAMLLCSPAWAYLGLRTTDKFTGVISRRKK